MIQTDREMKPTKTRQLMRKKEDDEKLIHKSAKTDGAADS